MRKVFVIGIVVVVLVVVGYGVFSWDGKEVSGLLQDSYVKFVKMEFDKFIYSFFDIMIIRFINEGEIKVIISYYFRFY